MITKKARRARDPACLAGKQSVGKLGQPISAFLTPTPNLISIRKARCAAYVASLLVALSVGNAAYGFSISSEPQSQTVPAGSNATFTVSTSGAASGNNYYQWWFNLTNALSGATNNVLTLTNAQPANNGGYRVIVSNDLVQASVTSQVATLTVLVPVTITSQPQGILTSVGQNISLNVGVSGSAPFTYQWRRNGTNLPNIIITVAGNGTADYSGDGGLATDAGLNYPFCVTADTSGNLLVADNANNRIRRVGTDAIIGLVAGNGTPAFGGDDGPATNASLQYPYGVAADPWGNIFIADSLNHRIRKVATNGVITTVAGNGTRGFSGDGTPATNANLSRPSGVIADASSNIFIADSENGRVRKVHTNGIIDTVAASLNWPVGLALDAAGNLFIAEAYAHRVRKLDTNGTVSTVAGNGTPDYSGDGYPAINASLNYPYGVTADPLGNLYIADSENYRIRKVGTDGIITTYAGNGNFGFSGDSGPATSSSMNWSYSVSADGFGNIFLSDTGSNNRIREVITRQSPTIQFMGAKFLDSGAYDVVISNGFSSTTSAVATVTIAALPLITNQPQSQLIPAGANAGFSVSAIGAAPLTYQWYFNRTNQLAGATNLVLILSNAQTVSAGAYTVGVSNAYGSVTSQVATLTVDAGFVRLTNSALELVSHGGAGISAVDYDNDGDLDILLVSPQVSGGIKLFQNSGNGIFVRNLTNTIVSEAGETSVGLWVDYDNDGLLDLIISKTGGQDAAVFHNNGSGAFTKVSVGVDSSKGGAKTTYDVTGADYDNDGLVDLFFPASFGQSDLLYHNSGNGAFSSVGGQPMLADAAWSSSATWGDYNNDGKLDLFVPNDGNSVGVSALYRNDGNGNFSLVSDAAISGSVGASEAAAWADFDNDGDLDLVVVNHATAPVFVFRNDGTNGFSRITNGAFASEINDVINLNWVDYDNDGWLDLFLPGAVGQAARLYRNNGDGSFSQILNGPLVTDAIGAVGSIWADVDRDGFPEPIVGGSPARIYHNIGNSNGWLHVKCVGTASNKAAIGAKVRLKATIRGNTFWQMREVSGGSGWGNQNLECYFGLGDATNIDLLRIEWPSGKVQQFTNVAPRQFLTIQEQTIFYLVVNGSGSVTYLPVKSNYFVGETVTLTATPARYYAFLRWSDGNTNAVRTISVSLTNTFTAIFTNTVALETIVVKQWEQDFGGSADDDFTSVQQTSDGGYILGGLSNSGASGNKTSGNYGNYDYWLVKVDANGGKQWEQIFGGNGDDELYSLQQTSDGGFILGGYSTSATSGNKTNGGFGLRDYWVVKLDPSGNKQWDKAFGGAGDDTLYSLQQTSDGGYVLGGWSNSGVSGNKTSANFGDNDYWVVKLDSTGAKQWEQSFGGAGDDQLHCLRQTSDGGYILGGSSASGASGNKTSTNYGGTDYWLVKLNASGSKQWEQSFGGNGADSISSVRQTSDGGFILGGDSASGVSGNKTSANYGGSDYWVVKLDANGNKVWENSFGGTGNDAINSLRQTSDGGYVLGGTSASANTSGNKTSISYGGGDYWVVRLDPNGNKNWEQSLGGGSADAFEDLLQSTDGGYLVGGWSQSGVSGNKSSPGFGQHDFWVLKLIAREAPVGTPLILVNGQYTPSNSYTLDATNQVVISLQTTYPNGLLFYRLDGGYPDPDDPASIQYSDPFTNNSSATVSAIAFDENGENPQLADPIIITVLPDFSLSASSPGGGSVSVSPLAGLYRTGTAVTLTATASNGWTFMRWQGSISGTSNQVLLTMDSAKTVSAIFGAFVTNTVPNGGGTVSVWPTNVAPYAYGTTNRYVGVPNSTNRFSRWFNQVTGPTNNPLDFPILTGNTNINAYFSSLGANFTLTTLLNGFGTVTRSPSANSYASNTTVQIGAVPDPGYFFVGWSGDTNSTQNPLSVTLNASLSITAGFSVTAASNTAPGVQITAPSSAASFTNPAIIIVSANASDSDGTVRQVEFYDGLTLLASTTNTPYSFTWTNAAVASHTLTAQAIDNLGARATSAPVSITVQTALPQVVLSSPTNGNLFFTPASISVNAVASDADNSIARVELYSQPSTNGSQPYLLSSITNPPYSFTWSSMLTGAYTLTARAVDSYGPSVTSAPVNLTVSAPPSTNPAVFSLALANYSVGESDGSLVVAVLNNGDLGGTINYATAPVTASEGTGSSGDYTRAQGSLTFTNGQHSANINIVIRDDFLFEPDETFEVRLSNPGPGASLGSISNAVVTIQDNDPSGATNSLLAFVFPCSPSDTSGRLRVTLLPSDANGQWRFAWEIGWRNSGQLVTNLIPGNYAVEFRKIVGYEVAPQPLSIGVAAGLTTEHTNQYFNAGSPGVGYLTVNLGPNTVVSNAGWRFLGELGWRAPGSTATNLTPGSQFIEFQPVSGWSAPPAREVLIFADQGTLISADYLIAAALPQGVALPTPVLNFAEVNGSLSEHPQLGFAFNGQLRSDAGLASGVVVRESVVLTAAHVVFNDETLGYVTEADWFFQKYAGDYDPIPLSARGWYVFSSYAAARTNDLPPVGSLSPGVSSPASRNWDVAVLYFLSPAACGGYGGYLSSDSATNGWLSSSLQKMLVGYPVDGASFGYAGVVPGKMHAIPGVNYHFTFQTTHVYSTPGFLSFPGNSGGPVYVQTNNIYYPAGVYLGTLGNASLVRAIDSNVVALINQAANLGDLGTNQTGGGVLTIIARQGSGSQAFVKVNLGPPAAVSAGGGWRIQGRGTNYYSDPAHVESVASNETALIEFKSISGWSSPSNRTVNLVLGQTTIIDAVYTQPAQLIVSPAGGLSASGFVGGPFAPASMDFGLTNTGGSDLNWSAGKNASWLSLSTISGSLPAGQGTKITVSVNGNADNLTATNYSDTVSFSNLSGGAGNTTRPVTLAALIHPPIVLSDFRFLDPTQIRVTLSGLPNHAYVIQRSANLSTWTDVLTITNVTGVISLTNTAPPAFSKAFYRAKEL